MFVMAFRDRILIQIKKDNILRTLIDTLIRAQAE